jgi:hypothetical protein
MTQTIAIETCPKCRATNWVSEGEVLIDDDGAKFRCWQCGAAAIIAPARSDANYSDARRDILDRTALIGDPVAYIDPDDAVKDLLAKR